MERCHGILHTGLHDSRTTSLHSALINSHTFNHTPYYRKCTVQWKLNILTRLTTTTQPQKADLDMFTLCVCVCVCRADITSSTGGVIRAEPKIFAPISSVHVETAPPPMLE